MRVVEALRRELASAEFARAYTLTVVGVAFSALAIENITSPVTLLTMLTLLSAIGAAVLVIRRAELSLLRLAPTSLLFFLAVATASLVWSIGRGDTLRAVVALLAYAFLAVTVGHLRDTLQTVRAIGDVLRLLLVISLGLEILSGILLDMPFPFLGIEGRLALGGPIEGLFGTRNMLGFIAVIALVTFAVEWRTRSIPRGLAIASTVLAAGMAFFASSPVVYVLAAFVAVAAGFLALVRATPAHRRARVQWSLGALVIVGVAVAFVLRAPLIALMGVGTDFARRRELWRITGAFVDVRPLQGWGWFGEWAPEQFPFSTISALMNEQQLSALNAYLDVLLQLGIVGLVAFLALGGIAMVRAWLVASTRRSVVYAWTPLILVALALESMVESFALVGAGWFLLVLCALRAGQSHSWRESIDAAHTGTIPTLSPRD